MKARSTLNFALVLLLAVGCCCQNSVMEDSPTPQIFTEQLHDNNYTFLLGQDVTIEYDNYYSEFEGLVMERNGSVLGDLLGDYAANRNQYQQSKVCWISGADFQFNDLETYMAENDTELQTYAVDENQRLAYLLTKDARLLQVRFAKNFSIEKQVKQLGKVDVAVGGKNTLHFHMGRSLYLINERGLYELRLKKQIEAFVVKGYNESANLVLPRNLHWYDDRLLAVRNEAVTLYKFTSTDQVVVEGQVMAFAGQQITASDAALEDNTLWVLDQIFGLFQYRKSVTGFEQINSYAIRYGKKLQLVVEPHCFQIVFELNKDTFVAELYLQDGQLHLNRFYDQIDGVRQVLMINELMLILGETEIMAIWHSINQQKLLAMDWQNKKFLNGFAVINVHLLKSFSTPRTEVLAVFSVDGFQILTLDKNYTVVRCNFKPNNFTNETELLGSHSIVIEFNSSFCDSNNHVINAGGFCRTVHSFNFQVAKPTERKMSMFISIGLFAISFVVAVVLVALSFNYRRNRQADLNKMRDLLRRRQEQYERSRNSGNNANAMADI